MTGLKSIGDVINRQIEAGNLHLNEDEAKEIFRHLKMPVVEEKKVTTRDQVLKAGDELGYPLVLKGLGKDMLHKTEAGLVIVGIPSKARLEEAVQTIEERGGADLEAFLVQPMIQGKRELVAGMFRDAQFGPVIMFGLGGILTEALEDIVFKIAPLEEPDLEDMLDGLTAQKLMGAFRGEAAVDRVALKTVLRGLSDLAVACPGIHEIDINPLIVEPSGRPVAVDGLMILGEPEKKPARKFEIDMNRLKTCYYPDTIAFVGASGTPGKWGHMLPTNTFARNFKGRVFLVNPKGENHGPPCLQRAG